MNERPRPVDGAERAVADGADPSEPRRLVDHFFRHESARLVAALTRRFGVRHWELAEDVVQTALERALSSWSLQGVPPEPAAWLHRVAVNRALDVLRRDARWGSLDTASDAADQTETHEPLGVPKTIDDDLLRMIFVCCHPLVPAESRIALGLKTLCGFANHEIARALLSTEASVSKRITRAKRRLRESGVELSTLTPADIGARLPDVFAVVYLLFNEGYSSSLSDKLIREKLCEEAVRLALILAEHPATRGPNSSAFLSLLLFHAARLDARIDDNGAMLLLREQDRDRWDRRLIREGLRWLGRATVDPKTVSRYHAEALIAAEHCQAHDVAQTNWVRIVRAYDLLCSLEPSPVHELNRAIALGHRDGAEAGLSAFSQIRSSTLEKDYYLWHAARADLLRQTGDLVNAGSALKRAWELAPTRSEKELICRKLDALPPEQREQTE